jgi:hypothetical protein
VASRGAEAVESIGVSRSWTTSIGLVEPCTRAIAEYDYRAGCPVGVVAQEAYVDPRLGEQVAAVVAERTTALKAVLMNAGHEAVEASDLAILGLSESVVRLISQVLGGETICIRRTPQRRVGWALDRHVGEWNRTTGQAEVLGTVLGRQNIVGDRPPVLDLA